MTIWSRSLNTIILQVLAIKFQVSGLEAIVILLHPTSMFLARVTTAGVITPSVRIGIWTNANTGTYRDLVTQLNVDVDNNSNVYMSTYAIPVYHFGVYRLNIKAFYTV